MTDVKEVWIAVNKKSQTENQMLCAWCSCMAGAYETCSHAIAGLYKIDYANTKGFCNPCSNALNKLVLGIKIQKRKLC